MSTHITLDDGRTLVDSNGGFDGIIEAVVAELSDRGDAVDGLADWLLDQRCRVQGPGVGYMDTRELSPVAATQFRAACISALETVRAASNEPDWLAGRLGLLADMWASIDRGEPPEALTDSGWRLDVGLPYGFEPRGPGWTASELVEWRRRYGQ